MDWEEKRKEIIRKLENKEKLTEKELIQLLDYEVDITEGENRRWSRTNESILEINSKFYCLVWEEGLTESQPNEFYEQPWEVGKKEYDKMIHVVEWVKK